jgi:hypothetical protein
MWSLQDFRGKALGSSTKGFQTIRLHDFGQSKVGKFDMGGRGTENVFGFEISMDNVSNFVQIVDGGEQSLHGTPCVDFGIAVLVNHSIKQVSTGHQLHDQIHGHLVMEKDINQLNNIGMIEGL